MTATQIVDHLLDGEPLAEATVRLPPRSRIWVAVFTGPTPGKQVWRSTGLTDRVQALVLAKKWEAEARQARAALGHSFKKPTIRVRRHQTTDPTGPLNQKEVALLLGMSERGVREVERRAFEKLRRHPLLRQVWQQYLGGELDEAQERLNPAECAALLGLCRTPEERALVQKLLWLFQT